MGSYSLYKKSQPLVVEIDDIERSNLPLLEDDHKARCKLAGLYRLIDQKGWSYGIYHHSTIRCKNPNHFLIKPFGLHYSEVTASNLIKIDKDGNIIERGTSTFGINHAGFVINSTIHTARPDINTVIHFHTGYAAGLSALKCGLLPISQEALTCGEISYHDYEGLDMDEKERQHVVKHLGPKNKLMVLRNHGIVACGSTLEEAWFLLFHFMAAAENQFHALAAVGGDHSKLVIPPPESVSKVQDVFHDGVMGVYTGDKKPEDEWRIGEMDVEMEMRLMDAMGYNTGYPYKKKNNQ